MYLGIHAVKNTTICQMVSLCNIQHYVMYNYIFRPCKWAIIRLFVEPEGWVCNRSLEGGGRDFVLHLKLLRNKTCPPPKFVLYSHPSGSTNNLMMAHLQGRNM